MKDEIKIGAHAKIGSVGEKSIGQIKIKRFYQESTWWWGVFWGFVFGIPSSYIASWLWAYSHNGVSC